MLTWIPRLSAVCAKNFGAVFDVAARWISRGRRCNGAKVGQDLPDFTVRRPGRSECRHLGVRYAGANRAEQPLVRAARGPDVRDVGAAHAAAVGAVAVGASLAKDAHARADGLGLPVERVFVWRVLRAQASAGP